MKIKDPGIKIITYFESCSLKSYKCPAGVLTIGYGHTGEDVKTDMFITKKQAEELLLKDLHRFEQAVTALLDDLEIEVNQNQFDALVSFAFNCGVGALQESTLIQKMKRGDIQGAADEFLRWNKAGGKVLEGLTRRRQAERRLFLAKL